MLGLGLGQGKGLGLATWGKRALAQPQGHVSPIPGVGGQPKRQQPNPGTRALEIASGSRVRAF